MRKYLAKALAVYAWAKTPKGRADIGAAVASVTAIYTALHRAHLL